MKKIEDQSFMRVKLILRGWDWLPFFNTWTFETGARNFSEIDRLQQFVSILIYVCRMDWSKNWLVLHLIHTSDHLPLTQGRHLTPFGSWHCLHWCPPALLSLHQSYPLSPTKCPASTNHHLSALASHWCAASTITLTGDPSTNLSVSLLLSLQPWKSPKAPNVGQGLHLLDVLSTIISGGGEFFFFPCRVVCACWSVLACTCRMKKVRIFFLMHSFSCLVWLAWILVLIFISSFFLVWF